MKRFCMVGVGSIGTRHLKNLTALLRERGVEFQIDALRSSDRPLPAETAALLHRTYTCAEDLPGGYDAVFITNPTALHYAAMQACMDKTRHMFIEKPVFDRTDLDLAALRCKPDGVYYVACPLRYRRVIAYMKELTQQHPVFAARAICSTYLPDWRPGVDYRQTYSARRELGGGVGIDLIHEWDYLCYLFGRPNRVYALSGTYSDLEVTSDDLAVYIGQYDRLLVSLHLDYFGRFDRREVELYLPDDVVVGDLIRSEVRFLKSGKTVALPESRDDYQKREIACFLDMLEGRQENHNPLALAVDVLKITRGETGRA